MSSSDISSATHAVSESLLATMKASPEALPSAFTRAQEVVAAQGSSSWLGLFGRLILAILSLISSILYWAIRIVTITIPTVLFTLFSTSWTVTMNATTLMVIMVAIISAVSWVVRYRILNMYSRLPPEPQRKEPDVDLFPESHDEGKKSGLSSYLDEFLSAIRIFGYLERQVFHELTRSMQTRKLIAGETFNLEEEKGFCIVVDGLVEIFVKSGRNARAMDPDPCDSFGGDSAYPGEDDDMSSAPQQRYQLLTEVRNGAPMSSLFSIMSLFTEDVKLRSTDDDTPEPTSGSGGLRTSPFPRTAGFRRMPSDPASPFPATPEFPETSEERTGVRIEEPPKRATTPNLPGSARIPPISLDSSGSVPSSARQPKRPPLQSRATSGSAHPDIIARATVDTTIAIIPASAFRRLTKVYPKATSHIVQVILSRFQRVTLATAYNYLGLTGEVLQTEKNMLSFTSCQLPNMLRGDALQRLKEKFDRERERVGGESESKGIALHNANAHRRRKSTSTLRKDAMMHSMTTKERSFSQVATTIGPPRERASTQTSPGDLLANIQSARHIGHRPSGSASVHLEQVADALRHEGTSPLAQRAFNPFTTQRQSRGSIDGRESLDEDNLFRQSILECMFKAIGLSSNGSVSREAESVEGSPRLFSYDQRRSRPGLGNNAFGLMGPFDASGDGDTESMTSGGFTLNTPPNAHILASDMKDDVEIVFFPKGSVLVEQGERNPGLYYVVDGFLDICTSKEDTSADILQSSSRTTLHTDHMGMDGSPAYPPDHMDAKKKQPYRRSVSLIKPGGLAGYVGTVSSYRSFIDVVAKTDVYVGFLPRSALERIVDRYPIVLLTMAKRLTSLLPRLIMHIDFALDWEQVDAGQVLFHEGEESEAIHIVLNGRLRLVQDRKDGGVSVRAEFGQGESVGELEVLTESVRPGTLHAIRQTELVKFPRTLFNSLAQEHPNITIKISKIIASRMRNLVDDPSQLLSKEAGNANTITKGSSSLNLRTVAILPVTSGVPVVEFGNRLMNALSQVGPANGATSLNQSAILNHLGKHAFNKMGKLKLSQYLADLEEKYGLVVYVADTNVNSPWTQTCITQADCILLVGLAEGSPEIGEYERFMLGMKSTARKLLVLLHSERYSQSGLTRAWLRNRMWINGGHYHVQMALGANIMPAHPPSKRTSTLKERVQIIQAEIQKYTSRKVRHSPFYSPDAPYKGDFHRLARRLCGKSVGLVLGGGGARGITQIGIIQAMEESGIPIDVVGGTSIGAFIGALYARHADVVPIFGLAKKFSGRMASMWRFALDLTYPTASYTTGHEFNRGIFKTFGKTQIEDFWLEYYCNTTNISKSRIEYHTSGYAWRYIRASMSLAGLLPPLCDEGSMLLDGGYIDNLTVSHMKRLGVDTIFSVDVGSLDDDTPQAYGDSLSGVWAFWNRWNPFSGTANPPTLAEIQARLAYVSSVDALERAKTMPGCFYMRPPIDDYGTLDFGKFDELYQMGYKYGQEYLQKLRNDGSLPFMEETEAKKAMRRTMAPRRASI
ncbi:lysophospholipase NTE1 [Colletotrichum paranaense]|uniref:Lysophospholipase NTE1 n=1 Tax=Colletotrichum paranaense TaxID=1914294 RepID=A0ABQ9SAE8_9PEZI|nr:lysophospholipase NTE1 [Colletotrichum paranaense]KAK1531362.1 lysophospholipase NTE1 [Colletotrichum paranaense]